MARTVITEDEIRPEALQSSLQECYKADLAWLMTRQEEFLACACPACSGTDRLPLFVKDGFHYHACVECGTAYISPRPSAAVLGDFYAISKVYRLFREKIFPASQEVRRREFVRPRVDRVQELCATVNISRPALLEAGAGFGIFCEEAASTNFFSRVVGIEPNRDLAAVCRARGINVIEKMFEDVQPEEVGTLDVICSFEVFEHLLEPRLFLDKCRSLLREGGLLILTCPNGRGFDLGILGTLSDTYNFEHLNYFNPRSLSRLLESCGFKVLETRTPGKLDVDLVRKAVLGGQLDISGNAFMRQVFVEEYDRLSAPLQTFLAENQLSGHMEIVASLCYDSST